MPNLAGASIMNGPEPFSVPLVWTGTTWSILFIYFPINSTDHPISRTRTKLMTGQIQVAGDQWPVFLYANFTYDLEDPWNGLLRSGLLLRFHRTCHLTDNCFLYTSTLADAMRSMDMSRSPDSLISYPRITCHRLVYSYAPVPVSRVSLTCTNADCRLVSSYLSIPCFSFCLIDSSMLTITAYAFPFVVCRLVSHLVISGP